MINKFKKQEKEISINFRREIFFSLIFISKNRIEKANFQTDNEKTEILETLKKMGEKSLSINLSKQIWTLVDRINQETKTIHFYDIADYVKFSTELHLLAMDPENLPPLDAF